LYRAVLFVLLLPIGCGQDPRCENPQGMFIVDCDPDYTSTMGCGVCINAGNGDLIAGCVSVWPGAKDTLCKESCAACEATRPTPRAPVYTKKPHQDEALELVWFGGFKATVLPPLVEWVEPDPTCAVDYPNSPPYMARLLGNQCVFGTYTVDPVTYKPLVRVVARGTIWESWFIHELVHAYLQMELGIIDYDHETDYFKGPYLGPIQDSLIATGY
jgi:hypothetical protein